MRQYFITVTLLGLALAHYTLSRPQLTNAGKESESDLHDASKLQSNDKETINPSDDHTPPEAIQENWAYPDYTQLSDLARLALFPWLYILPGLPALEVIQIYENLNTMVNLDIPTRELQKEYGSDPIIETLNQSDNLKWGESIHIIHLTQITVSTNAVFTITGQFSKLRELLEIPIERSPTWTVIFKYAFLLLLEFDNSDADQDDKLVARFRYNCDYAGALGFKTAEEKCKARSRAHYMNRHVLSGLTADGFVYPHRDSNDNPKLAIRVCRSTVVKILEEKEINEGSLPWLDNNILLDQLHLLKFRPGLPPPRLPSQE
ncbi:hypothetical protein H4R33_001670 [Dimargaris cristalligena]|nr:hypothetical protein H4R33_001670 [Dimargaris cristalligena]